MFFYEIKNETRAVFLYIKKNKITITKLSKEIGCSREHLNKVINGQKKPSNGEVKAEYLMKEE